MRKRNSCAPIAKDLHLFQASLQAKVRVEQGTRNSEAAIRSFQK